MHRAPTPKLLGRFASDSSGCGLVACSQFHSSFLFHHSALEEIRVHAPVQMDRVGKYETLEVLFGQHAVPEQLVCFRYYFEYIRNIPMRDVRAEERVQGPTEALVESDR